MLQKIFFDLLAIYTNDIHLAKKLWTEIEQHYSEPKRHYHTLQHLNSLLRQLQLVKDKIENWEVILFSLFYHDIIYNPLLSDNEEKSAVLAVKRMKEIGVDGGQIEVCQSQILATKAHTITTNNDTNYFIDADLSVLGQDWEIYCCYCQGVREEYSIYPDFIYNQGRKKVLNHFLLMDKIFKTSHFYTLYECKAKQNLQKEIESLR
jgi:predicted metal-dependent HD superfamily phosphohydrolase